MTAFESNNLRSYSQEEVQQILQLAIARQTDERDQEFSYQQIIEIAAELQISPEAVKQAESDWICQKSEVQQRQAFDLYRQGKFKKRLGNYAIINTFFTLVDLVAGAGISWSLYILLFCGLAIALDIWNTFQNKGEEYEIAFQKWNRKHQIKQTINTVLNRWFKAFQTH
ncbi:2TM domain-containing protein [Sphaerospermopsis aphanizomenoides BCCUSP55]|uniref:2TM domain-containing protein n=1 Tax=Sphaerospermopsis aphanizomenoides TaxID=459663 RepID=UPI00190314B7|nr:2TM domain-containing protein [Sphaerospermopsis aphanizomenoides]MBK1988264.1 2TM domain-containing protein [Sphaerospermopsis aphanizomenoides BCCUSP55]